MEKTIFKTGICANCGADKQLHHYQEPNRCPLHGREPYGDNRQEWGKTFFEDSGEKQLRDAAPQLYEALAQLVNQIPITDQDKYEAYRFVKQALLAAK